MEGASGRRRIPVADREDRRGRPGLHAGTKQRPAAGVAARPAHGLVQLQPSAARARQAVPRLRRRLPRPRQYRRTRRISDDGEPDRYRPGRLHRDHDRRARVCQREFLRQTARRLAGRNRPDLVRAIALEDPPLFSAEYPRIKTTIADRSFATCFDAVRDDVDDFLLYWIHSNRAFFSSNVAHVSMRKRASFDWSCWRQTPAASREARPSRRSHTGGEFR